MNNEQDASEGQFIGELKILLDWQQAQVPLLLCGSEREMLAAKAIVESSGREWIAFNNGDVEAASSALANAHDNKEKTVIWYYGRLSDIHLCIPNVVTRVERLESPTARVYSVTNPRGRA